MLVESLLCARHCSKLWRNSSEQSETSALVELAFDHGVGVRGQKIKKANKQNTYSVSDGGRQREGEKVGKGTECWGRLQF